jgi:hypothetical protein
MRFNKRKQPLLNSKPNWNSPADGAVKDFGGGSSVAAKNCAVVAGGCRPMGALRVSVCPRPGVSLREGDLTWTAGRLALRWGRIGSFVCESSNFRTKPGSTSDHQQPTPSGGGGGGRVGAVAETPGLDSSFGTPGAWNRGSSGWMPRLATVPPPAEVARAKPTGLSVR